MPGYWASMSVIPNNKAELERGNQRSKQWHTHTGPGQPGEREECGPDTLASALCRGVCRVSPAEQTSHIIIIRSSFIFITTYTQHILTTTVSIRYQGFRVSLESRWSISLHEIGVTPNKVLMLPTLCRSPGSLTPASHQNLSDRMEICSPPVLSINLDPEPNKKFVWTLLNCLGVGGQRGMMFYHSRTGNQFYGLFVFLFRCSFVAFLPTLSSAGLGRARQDPVGWLGRVGFLDRDKNLIVSVHIIRRFVQIIK